MEYILNDVDSLNRLRTQRALKDSIRKIKVTTGNINLPGMFEKKLNKYYFACGCAEGQIAVWCTMLAFSMLWLIDRNSDLLVWWKVVSCVFASAFLGKVVGLMINHRHLQRMYSELENLLSS